MKSQFDPRPSALSDRMESSDRSEIAQDQFLEHILIAEPVSTSAEYALANISKL
jgi:hypothetical protein